ncbi:M14 family zinc carboxypeptidase [Dyadobacter sp. CY356]|uniref:M14 family zinc carboxypeptidase n=1 Tax=Dyadobacter sp. CY356 TaxID=2906442 RepID=UPI001F2FBFEF|nr:M14 family zinc carboxypeptidase [Dyadobacter sp. CY356]MCF0057652.1 peptidase M14 [Dyadobacter sp. CY356]
MKALLSLFLFLITTSSYSQSIEIAEKLMKSHDRYKEKSLTNRRFKHKDIQLLITKRSTLKSYEVSKVGESFEGRSITMLKVGNGPHKIMAWSQMHGDEPTATMATFDIFNFLEAKGDGFDKLRKTILDSTTIYFIPMLNPDGAERYQRRNAQGFDLNRDAVFLQAPEAKILKDLQNNIKPEFGFNLHDQSPRYSVGRSEKKATISFLATAYDYPRSINSVREKSMQMIINMNRNLQKFIPGQVGRYSDDHEPRAFGDNFQKWGTTLILVESGGYAGDPEKQYIRKLNFMTLLTAFETISLKTYAKENKDQYEDIPENGRSLFDLVVRGATIKKGGKSFLSDLGINRNEVNYSNAEKYFYSGKVEEYGDLSTVFGTEEINASGLVLENGKVYPTTISTKDELKKLSAKELFKQGYTYVKLTGPDKEKASLPSVYDQPFHLLRNGKNAPSVTPEIGSFGTFLLKKNDVVRYAVVNGFVYDMENFKVFSGNGVIE